MVLKKSKGRLNSGATQRVNSGWASRSSTMSAASQQLLTLTLSNDPTNRQIQGHTFKTLWDKLGWDGPLLRQFHLDHDTKQRWPAQKCFSLSLNKAKRWLLPARIKLLRSEPEFLETVLKEMELCVSERVETPNKSRSRGDQKFTASQIVSRAPTDEEPGKNSSNKNSSNRSRLKTTKHGRGLQRPHLFKRTKNPRTEPVEVSGHGHFPPVTLHLELYAFYHLDVRCPPKNYSRDRRGTKSANKTKCCINGRLAWRRGYSRSEMKEMVSEMSDERQLALEPETNPDPNIEPSLFSQTFSLSEFIIVKKLTQKRCRHKKSNKEECGDVGWKEKYPKGSFVVVSRDEIESCSVNKTSWELVDTHDVNTSLLTERHLGENQSLDQIDLDLYQKQSFDRIDLSQDVQENIQIDEIIFNSETLEFDNSFFPVELEMSKEEKQMFTSENCSEKSMEINGFQITMGNCFPKSFVLHLHKPNDLDNQIKCFIIGRKLDAQSSSWLISVQGEKNQKLRDRLVTETKRSLSSSTCLSDFILNALGIVTEDINSGLNNFGLCSNISSSKYSETESLWQMLPNRPNTIICSAEKAYSYLKKNNHLENQQEHHNHVNESIEVYNVINHMSQNTGHDSTYECNVCYLQVDISRNSLMLSSCGHMFCVPCWRSHFYHSIRLGANHLTCLAPRCSTRVDVTAAMTILPLNRIKQWLTHVRDRYLHTNLFCNWCPGDSCSNVAVSLTAPLKSQFGVPVTCDCQLTWCSNCQSKPHWPASCDQMAAYNKLLYKVCESEKYRKGSADFYINLKPCPQCDYPIEKNEGCPSMVCTMCYFNFCWNCLKGATTHVIYNCRPNGNNFVTYVLTNELAHDLPLKYFPECLEVNKARRCDKLRRWALTLSLSRPGQIWPRPPLVSDCSDGQVVHQMTH